MTLLSDDKRSCSSQPAGKEWAVAPLMGALRTLDLHDKQGCQSLRGTIPAGAVSSGIQGPEGQGRDICELACRSTGLGLMK